MPEDLTSTQEQELLGDLSALILEVTTLVEQSSDRTDTVDLDQPIGRLSRIDAIQEQKMAQAQMRRHKLRLQQAKAALKAVDDGVFGECRKCSEAVGYKRLKARPETPFCVECQQVIEKRR